MHKIIGVDIGGTKISVVLGTSTGRILEKQVIKYILDNSTINKVEGDKSSTEKEEVEAA